MKKLPLGIQDFGKLRRGDYLYVDKTELIYRLLNTSGYLFLSRPRRFGKSLLASTFRELFLGHQELFAGLWIEDKMDWQPYPVIYIDLNAIDYRNHSLEEELSKTILSAAEQCNISLASTTSKNRFTELIKALSREEKGCVVLIDEYDKPITDLLEESEQAAEHVKTLKNFYGVLKSQDQHLHFVFITGVSKYGKVSIFSDLNNLYDVTLDPAFATLTGYTPEEVQHYFKDHLTALPSAMRKSPEDLMDRSVVQHRRA
ncbi:MAG: AAA family ATPase [Tunicatimonas sp.]